MSAAKAKSVATTTTTTLRRRRRKDRRVVWVLLVLGVVGLGWVVWEVWPYWRMSSQFAERHAQAPSRLYGRATRLLRGAPLSAGELAARISARGYRTAGEKGLVPGTFRATANQVAVYLRRFPTPRGFTSPSLLVVDFTDGHVGRLKLGDKEVDGALIEPPLLASFYGPELRDRWPVKVDELPDHVIRSVLAAEDAAFFEHPGISPTGILRALWTNLRGGEIRQGGSTLTQQLVKNLYLSAERTVSRKAREALLAILLELRYGKREILEAYLNEIYWGRTGSVDLIGLGAAARGYLGKPPEELTLAEAALLAGMIRAPGELLPTRYPERAKERRDMVLRRLGGLRWAPEAELTAALATPVAAQPGLLGRNRAPYFVDQVTGEAKRRWQVGELADTGYTLLSTLDLEQQESAEKAVDEGLGGLEKGAPRLTREGRGLQAALVAIEPRSGGLVAYVGGRDYKKSQYDRVSQARRQAGSAFKPVVYAAAFEGGAANPATMLEDAPLTVELPTMTWSPMDDDDEFRGWVTARYAVEHSLNIPTARLALSFGLDPIIAMARKLGITSDLQPVPALSLGAFEVTPLELATVYATFARQGVRPAVHGLDGVLDAAGKPMAGQALPPAQPVLSAITSYLVTSILQGVLDRGTAVSARRLGLRDPVAGKTGTTNNRRDSWFGGYSPELATLVWVGFDDNAPTPFHGSQAALPIFVDFALAVRPAAGFSGYTAPAGVLAVIIDPESGELATDRCPKVESEIFFEQNLPTAICHLHGGRFARPLGQPGLPTEQQPQNTNPFLNWLHRVFGRDQRPGPASPPPD